MKITAKIYTSLSVGLLCLGLIFPSLAATPIFDWKTEIATKAQGVVIKTLSASEIDPRESHQRAFHGTKPIRALLGEKRITLHAKFVYAGKDREVFSESFVTWYNAFEGRTDVKPRWHIYYPETRALSFAHTGDQLMVARMKDDELVLVITPKDGDAAKWMETRAANDNRPAVLPPPKAIAPERIPLPVSLPQSFTQAKKLLTTKVYANDNDRKTFYCGCDYSREGKIDPLSCGYVPKRSNSVRAKRLEWEHIVPAAYIGKGRMCWEQGTAECTTRSGKSYKGRKCCEKVDKQFREIEADLNNLAPEIGELNADRRDFPYRDIPGEKREYGACDFEVDRKLKEAEPAVPLRGFIGRVWLYMNEAHGVPMSEEDRQIYTAWAKAYPPQPWEVDRQRRIKETLEKAK